MKALFIIVNQGFSEDAVKLIVDAGARGATIVQARGGASKLSFLSIEIEESKEIIISLVSEELEQIIAQKIQTEIGPETNANGISFVLPVDSVNFINKLDAKD